MDSDETDVEVSFSTRRCRSTPASTIIVANTPTSSNDEGEV
ncbi:hypothetical protein NECAME_17987 [Necator americanus]|uniref:Uncharacterized protein n=1 Tax=Necator americanus TaxID=51031 RepID=W2TGC3_NECAM|nr:hypothetical protein NECAME_17987 [Necator americanus]ETN80649.1 hypothetical protein NECAME_17987 [Necator americanus]